MQTSLAVTALLMGLAGGPHCIAMCGAACAGIGRAAGASPPPTRLFPARLRQTDAVRERLRYAACLNS